MDPSDPAEAQIAARLVVEREQASVAGGRRHRRVAVVEFDRRRRLRQMLGDDLAHRAFGFRLLFR
jgi:hypothetical protein